MRRFALVGLAARCEHGFAQVSASSPPRGVYIHTRRSGRWVASTVRNDVRRRLDRQRYMFEIRTPGGQWHIFGMKKNIYTLATTAWASLRLECCSTVVCHPRRMPSTTRQQHVCIRRRAALRESGTFPPGSHVMTPGTKKNTSALAVATRRCRIAGYPNWDSVRAWRISRKTW